MLLRGLQFRLTRVRKTESKMIRITAPTVFKGFRPSSLMRDSSVLA